MKSGKLVLGILAGVTAGALLGILFAPDKGSKTRKKIIGKGEDFAGTIKDKLDEFSAAISEKYTGAKQEMEALVSRNKTKYENVKKEVMNATT